MRISSICGKIEEHTLGNIERAVSDGWSIMKLDTQWVQEGKNGNFTMYPVIAVILERDDENED